MMSVIGQICGRKPLGQNSSGKVQAHIYVGLEYLIKVD
jgi:hypothetical protein